MISPEEFTLLSEKALALAALVDSAGEAMQDAYDATPGKVNEAGCRAYALEAAHARAAAHLLRDAAHRLACASTVK